MTTDNTTPPPGPFPGSFLLALVLGAFAALLAFGGPTSSLTADGDRLVIVHGSFGPAERRVLTLDQVVGADLVGHTRIRKGRLEAWDELVVRTRDGRSTTVLAKADLDAKLYVDAWLERRTPRADPLARPNEVTEMARMVAWFFAFFAALAALLAAVGANRGAGRGAIAP